MTIDVRPEPGAATASGAGSSQNTGRRRNMILLGIGLGLVIRVLRDRRFYTYAITAIIVLVTGSKAAKENQTKSFQRLVEWNKRQTQRVERHVKSAAYDVKVAAHEVKESLPG